MNDGAAMAKDPAVVYIPGLFMDCAGGCGVLVRQEAAKGMCDKCLELDCMLEARRLRDDRDRRFGIGQYAPLRGVLDASRESERIDTGVVAMESQHPEDDNGTISFRSPLSWGERVALLLGMCMSVGVAGAVGYVGWMGVRWITAKLLGVEL